MNSLETQNNELVFDQRQIIPQGNNLGSHIDRQKVINDSIGAYFPKPVNWNKSINEQGEFDTNNFILSRLSTNTARKGYLKTIQENLNYFTHLKKNKDNRTLLYTLKNSIEIIIKQFERMYFLEKNGAIYDKPFYLKLKNLHDDLKEQTVGNNNLVENTNDTSGSIKEVEKVESLIQECLSREEKERDKYFLEITEKYVEGTNKYIIDGKLDVKKILETIDSHRERNTDTMLIAFYTARSNKDDLRELQEGVVKVLENKFKKLDTTKIFTILERILPYINEDFNLKFDLPEIFRPEYLNNILSYDLTLEKFSDQIKNNGERLGRSKEIQNKLIEQFKIFGQSEGGKIAFGQGSEQLCYWTEITKKVNDRNFKHYLKDENLGEEKRPKPKILEPEYKNSHTNEDLLEVLQ